MAKTISRDQYAAVCIEMHTRKIEIEQSGMTASAVGAALEGWIGKRYHHGCVARAAAVAGVTLAQSSSTSKVKSLTEEVASLRAQLAAAQGSKQKKAG